MGDPIEAGEEEKERREGKSTLTYWSSLFFCGLFSPPGELAKALLNGRWQTNEEEAMQ